jgi:hypothetical protein
LVLELLSLNRHIIFPENFKQIIEEKNCIQQQVFKLDKQACFGGKFLASKNEKIYPGFNVSKIVSPITSAVMFQGTV